MNRRSRLLIPFGALLAGCAQLPEAQPADVKRPQAPFLVEEDGTTLVLSIADRTGIPLQDFIKLSQPMLGKVFTYKKPDLERAARVALVGDVRVEKADYYEFFQTMLRLRGLECVERSEGVVEIRSLGE